MLQGKLVEELSDIQLNPNGPTKSTRIGTKLLLELKEPLVEF